MKRGRPFTLTAAWNYRKSGSATLQVRYGGKWMDTTVGKRPVHGTHAGKWSGWKKR